MTTLSVLREKTCGLWLGLLGSLVLGGCCTSAPREAKCLCTARDPQLAPGEPQVERGRRADYRRRGLGVRYSCENRHTRQPQEQPRRHVSHGECPVATI